MVLVDTCVWSLGLRRAPRRLDAAQRKLADELREMVREGRAALTGPIRQEILSGMRDEVTFERVRDRLRPFPDVPLDSEDYERAARFFNQCRAKGITGSPTDVLICAVAVRHNLPIFTIDRDFRRFAGHLPIRLHVAGR